MKKSELVADYCKRHLSLDKAVLGDEYYYQSLPLCIIDAVFSIGIKYQTVQKVVQRYCNFFKLSRIKKDKNIIPNIEEQQSVSEFIDLEKKYDFTNNVFCNKNRTSPHNGILKSEAVFLFANVLKEHDINYFQDMNKLYANYYDISDDIMQIQGQKSGISLKYFLMLAGNDNLIKPDRQISTFLQRVLNMTFDSNMAQILLSETCDILKKDYPSMNLRLLDHLIWNYQRDL